MAKKITEMMTRNVETVHQDATVKDAATAMKKFNVGSLPVVDDARRVVGMLTDRDIVLRQVAEGKDPEKVKVREVMTKDYVYCYEDQDVREAARMMSYKQIRRLLILNHDTNLVGILSLGDLSVDSGDEKLSGQTLEDISKPSKPNR